MNPADRRRAREGTALLAGGSLAYVISLAFDFTVGPYLCAMLIGWTAAAYEEPLRATLWPWMAGRQRTFYPTPPPDNPL